MCLACVNSKVNSSIMVSQLGCSLQIPVKLQIQACAMGGINWRGCMEYKVKSNNDSMTNLLWRGTSLELRMLVVRWH